MKGLRKYLKMVAYAATVMLLLAGCSKNAPLAIDISGKPVLDTVKVDLFNYDTVNVTCGQTVVISYTRKLDFFNSINGLEISDVKYLWHPTGDTTPTTIATNIPDSSYVQYWVEITATVTWDDTDTTISNYPLLNDTIIVEGKHLPLYVIPSAFTPNGDGWNDAFKVSAICYTATNLKIFDTYSNSLIFESNDIDRGWDGTYKGKKMPSDEYRYAFEITSVDNEVEQAEGYLQLIR